jgi:heme A synthase
METMVLVFLIGVMLAISAFLIGSMIQSIRKEKKSSNRRRTWANFALSIAFCILFLASWLAHGVAEWQVFASEQRAHHDPVEVTEFIHEFSQSTLENWQSEFLQLFSFVVLAALFIHRGSAESKDSDDRMEAALKRIEERLDQLAPSR